MSRAKIFLRSTPVFTCQACSPRNNRKDTTHASPPHFGPVSRRNLQGDGVEHNILQFVLLDANSRNGSRPWCNLSKSSLRPAPSISSTATRKCSSDGVAKTVRERPLLQLAQHHHKNLVAHAKQCCVSTDLKSKGGFVRSLCLLARCSERQQISDPQFVAHAADHCEEPFLRNAVPQHFAFAAATSRYRGITTDIKSNRDHPVFFSAISPALEMSKRTILWHFI